MPMGFVYILFNLANPGKVKIGHTIGTSDERARELYTTGVADSFHVVYDELVSDCALVEGMMHKRFAKFRNNKKREFFDIAIKTAVKALSEVAKPFLLPESALTIRCEILPKLKKNLCRRASAHKAASGKARVGGAEAIFGNGHIEGLIGGAGESVGLAAGEDRLRQLHIGGAKAIGSLVLRKGQNQSLCHAAVDLLARDEARHRRPG